MVLDLERLLAERGSPLVTDGAWGTELAARGLPPGGAPEHWNLERPEAVREVAAAYVAAGSDIVLTNTFGGTRLKLARAGLADRTEEVNVRGAELSVEAAAGGALVFASVGPTGEMLEPYGTLSLQAAREAFVEQVRCLAEGGVDGVVIETMSDLDEAKCALQAAKESCLLPVVVCLSFEPGASGAATVMGVRPEQAAAELLAAGADAVGANCGGGSGTMLGVIRTMRATCDLPLWAKPNAGKPELIEGRTVYRATPEEMAAQFGELAAAGAAFIGGCCGTTPEHVRRLAAEAAKLRAPAS